VRVGLCVSVSPSVYVRPRHAVFKASVLLSCDHSQSRPFAFGLVPPNADIGADSGSLNFINANLGTADDLDALFVSGAAHNIFK
jgi:hypothetical protein